MWFPLATRPLNNTGLKYMGQRKILCLSGLEKFEPELFKGQLYNIISSLNIDSFISSFLLFLFCLIALARISDIMLNMGSCIYT